MNDDIIVVFFGDHQPALNDRFISELNGSSLDTFDEEMVMYKIPFFIWTNYESDFKEVELTSLNYLSTLLFEKAEMDLPVYNKYLENLSKDIPAVNSKGYYSKSNGSFMKYIDSEGAERELLDEYWALEYNCLFGDKNRNNDIYPLHD